MLSKPALEPLGKDMRALWTTNSGVEEQLISVGTGTEQVSLCECFSLRAALLSTVNSAILSSPTAIAIPALTLPSSYLVQMERSCRSNSLFCCSFLSRFGFFSRTPTRIRLLIIALRMNSDVHLLEVVVPKNSLERRAVSITRSYLTGFHKYH